MNPRHARRQRQDLQRRDQAEQNKKSELVPLVGYAAGQVHVSQSLANRMEGRMVPAGGIGIFKRIENT